MTEFVQLTEMWHDGHYNKLGVVIRKEKWSTERIMEFCAYFGKHVGMNQLNILYKFI